MVAAFKQYLADKEFDYKSAGIIELEKLEASLKKEGKLAEMKPSLSQLRASLNAGKSKDFEANLDFIKMRLKAEISAKIGGMKAKVEAVVADDPVLQKGIEILSEQAQYQALLAGESQKSD